MDAEYWWESQKERGPLGKPRRRSEDNIKINFRRIGWSGMDLMIWLRIGTSRGLL
jgi:hypothetical protein